MENSLTTTEPKKVVTQDLSQIEGWLKTRKEFIDKVASMAVEGKDFHVIKNSKSLAKGGAEKIASIFHWTAQFRKDTETLEMLGNPKDVIAYICELKNGEYVGEGRGARKLSQDSGDINKAIKMAQKSAYIDAVLRSSGLSDIFTQDLEDMGSEYVEQPKEKLASEKQHKLIQDLAKQKGVKKISDVVEFELPARKEEITMPMAKRIIDVLMNLPTVGAMRIEVPPEEMGFDVPPFNS